MGSITRWGGAAVNRGYAVSKINEIGLKGTGWGRFDSDPGSVLGELNRFGEYV